MTDTNANNPDLVKTTWTKEDVEKFQKLLIEAEESRKKNTTSVKNVMSNEPNHTVRQTRPLSSPSYEDIISMLVEKIGGKEAIDEQGVDSKEPNFVQSNRSNRSNNSSIQYTDKYIDKVFEEYYNTLHEKENINLYRGIPRDSATSPHIETKLSILKLQIEDPKFSEAVDRKKARDGQGVITEASVPIKKRQGDSKEPANIYRTISQEDIEKLYKVPAEFKNTSSAKRVMSNDTDNPELAKKEWTDREVGQLLKEVKEVDRNIAHADYLLKKGQSYDMTGNNLSSELAINIERKELLNVISKSEPFQNALTRIRNEKADREINDINESIKKIDDILVTQGNKSDDAEAYYGATYRNFKERRVLLDKKRDTLLASPQQSEDTTKDIAPHGHPPTTTTAEESGSSSKSSDGSSVLDKGETSPPPVIKVTGNQMNKTVNDIFTTISTVLNKSEMDMESEKMNLDFQLARNNSDIYRYSVLAMLGVPGMKETLAETVSKKGKLTSLKSMMSSDPHSYKLSKVGELLQPLGQLLQGQAGMATAQYGIANSEQTGVYNKIGNLVHLFNTLKGEDNERATVVLSLLGNLTGSLAGQSSGSGNNPIIPIEEIPE
jgi:hypothetical protein